VAYSTDDKEQFVYEAFNHGRDFGPLDISRTVMYCQWVEALCKAHAGSQALVHLAPEDEKERANTVVLCGAYLVLVHGLSPEEAVKPFEGLEFTPFVDCRGGVSAGSDIPMEDEADFLLSALDVLRGLAHVHQLGWVDCNSFDIEEHLSMLRPERGDMSWILPGKAIGMASPWAADKDQDGLPVCTPDALSPYFLDHNVRLVVQCNCPEREEEGERRRLLLYEPERFDAYNIRHVQLPFEDGGCPSVDLLLAFLDLVSSTEGCFAVHCRSGLGRTATLIGAYAIRYLGFTARSFIGWARLVRPGTVHGSQQQYLENLERHVLLDAQRPLDTLSQLECLALLPRRELRFWALDSGIPAERTEGLSEDRIIHMILEAHGLVDTVPEEQQEEQERQPQQPQQLLTQQSQQPQQLQQPQQPQQPQTQPQTQPQSQPPPQPPQQPQSQPQQQQLHTTTLKENQKVENFGPDSGTTTSTMKAAPFAQKIASHGEEVKAALVQEDGPRAEREPMNGSTWHSSSQWKSVPTIAPAPSPSASTTQASLSSQTTTASETATPSQCLSAHRIDTSLTTPCSSTGRRSPSSGGLATVVDDWDEVLRYLNLYKAVHSNGDMSWDSVGEILEQLRDVHRSTPAAAPKGANSKALHQLRTARQAVERETASRSKDLAEALHQVRELQHECEILKMQLSVEREDRCSRKQRGEVQKETLLGDLKAEEARLQLARSEVQEAQTQLLNRGLLREEQVKLVRDLRGEVSSTEDMTARLKAMSFGAQARLDALCRQETLQQLGQESRCASSPSRPANAGVAPARSAVISREASLTVPLHYATNSTEYAEAAWAQPPRTGAKVLDERLASPPLTLGGKDADCGVLSWDSVRRSIERLRSKCHLAAIEARREREALAARDGSSAGARRSA